LLAAGFVVALVLWVTIGAGDRGDGASTTIASSASAAPPAGPARISAVVAYDPEGDGEENDQLASAAIADGDPATNWRTECYAGTMLGSKDGVGLAVDLTASGTGTLSFNIGNAPYQVEVYASDGGELPAGFADWGPAISDKVFSDQPGTVQVTVPAPARHLLIVLREIGRDSGCSSANPYRASIGEISFT
jgi:hypothetical protein